jgi:cold shock CspA family protein
MRATITGLHADRGFGFAILHDGGDRVFVHASACVPGENYQVGSIIEIDKLIDHGRGGLLSAHGVRLAPSTPVTGIVERVNPRGFAFIRLDDGSEVFAHATSFLCGTWQSMTSGTRVEVQEVATTPGGLRAYGVSIA